MTESNYKISSCAHCKRRIIRIEFEWGDCWYHQPAAAVEQEQLTMYCRMTVAAPVEEDE